MRKAIALLVPLLLLPLAVVSFRFLGSTPAGNGPPASRVGMLANEATSQAELLRGAVYFTAARDRRPLEGAVVWLGGTREFAVTDAGGEFRFSVEVGVYTLRGRLGGWRCEPETTEVQLDEGAYVEIECEPWPPVRAMETTTVTISVDTASGIVTVWPSPLYVVPGHCVVWTSDDGPWAVHFSPISPLTHRRIRGAAHETRGDCAREDIFPGKYSYFVAVQVGDSIYTEDPELIDENEN